jgi:hypothetical protein
MYLNNEKKFENIITSNMDSERFKNPAIIKSKLMDL